MKKMKTQINDEGLKVRYESFGGIVGINDPPALVYVNKKIMKELGLNKSELWNNPQGYLSAPTEVHFNITNSCPLNCSHCTTDASCDSSQDMSTDDIKRAIDVLADMKVFHIAFGGGELFIRQDAIEIAEYAILKGIVPNATTNGYYMTAELADKCKIFGQINVSLDGLGENYGVIRGINAFDKADNAIKLLVNAGVSTGINCVVTKMNFDKLEEVISYADNIGVKEVLLIRLKPSGRAKAIYNDFKLTHQQNTEFYPFIMKMMKKYKPMINIDCSFTPNICYHKPLKWMMKKFGCEGCTGGDSLLGLRHDGYVNACSHYGEYIENVFQLPTLWNEHSHFKSFRDRSVADENCVRCKYFEVCRGGCPLFSEFIKGDFNLPDPECPILVKKQK